MTLNFSPSSKSSGHTFVVIWSYFYCFVSNIKTFQISERRKVSSMSATDADTDADARRANNQTYLSTIYLNCFFSSHVIVIATYYLDINTQTKKIPLALPTLFHRLDSRLVRLHVLGESRAQRKRSGFKPGYPGFDSRHSCMDFDA